MTACGPVELSNAAAQRLACDATLRVVVTDDTQVLGVTAALRAALIVRDGGCRFAGCGQPPDLCDAHHVVPVVEHGPTVLENLALVCRDHHRAIHESGWRVTLEADAAMTFARRGATLVSQPRARQRVRPAGPPSPGRPRRASTQPPDTDHGSPPVSGSTHTAAGAEPDNVVDTGHPDRGPVLLPF